MKNQRVSLKMQGKSIKNANRIWISSPHNLGDFIAKIPLIRILKQRFPHCKIILAARAYVKELVDLVEEVDEFIDFEQFFSLPEDAVVAALKNLKIDVLIHILSLQNHIGPDVAKLAKSANVPNRIGNIKRSLFSLWVKKARGDLTHNICKKRIISGMHEYQWNLLALKFFGIEKKYGTEEITDLLEAPLPEGQESQFIKKGKFNLVIHPGSHGNAKEWPEEKFIELLKLLEGSNIHPIITGSTEESHRFKKLGEFSNITFAMGRCSLKEFIALISQCNGLIAASTGPIHIAALFNTKALGLFPMQKDIGADVWRPLGKGAMHLASSIVCSACIKKISDFNPKLCTCMQDIEAADVCSIITQWNVHESTI
ncbi:MAG: hypothetical protein S4CHLAM6_02680 [Chlamydiae bacterium]|nr:hypothetical protein [Chlamydiota bacterium]